MTWKNDQVTIKETDEILSLAQKSLEAEGDFTEFGCYAGDTSLLLAEILLKQPNKKLWIYDSFEGLPQKTSQDFSEAGKDFQAGELSISKRDVKLRFLRAGIPVPIIKKAWFSELKNEDIPEKIAFAFLDGDFYSSIKDSLRLVENRMSACGKLIIHDYNNPALPGVARAVDEWAKENQKQIIQKFSLAIVDF